MILNKKGQDTDSISKMGQLVRIVVFLVIIILIIALLRTNIWKLIKSIFGG